MPQHKSAAKRVRQAAKRRQFNRYHKTRVRTMIKDLQATNEPEAARAKLDAVKAQLDRLAGRRVMHPNTAANTKSRLEQYVNSLGEA
ncbi:MAG: 30S ribosomal protein S20 [Rubricoccaceae bacterium]